MRYSNENHEPAEQDFEPLDLEMLPTAKGQFTDVGFTKPTGRKPKGDKDEEALE
jgi:hypothetical protein